MKVPAVELSDCIRCGICLDVCPAVFHLNAAGYIEIIGDAPYPKEEVEEAIKNCPADCIYWEQI